MTPTPEPGQPVWIAAEVVPSVAGHPMLTPITADGQPSTIWLAPARYRWQPVDVPPQPPVLDEGTTVRLAGDQRLWRVRSWWPAPDDEFGELSLVLADVPGPDDSTPEPASAIEARRAALAEREAGEAQEGAQAAPRVANSSTGANGSLPAVQGAGRDWRGELVAVLLKHGPGDVLTCRCGWGPSQRSVIDLANHRADAIVAALGLHDLEQAAEQWHDYWSQAVAERDTEARLRRSEIAEADKLAADLRAERDEALVDRDAARRELEQLRGDVSAIAHDCAARAAIPAGKAIPPDLWYTADRAQIAERLRAALAATAPATQDGADRG